VEITHPSFAHPDIDTGIFGAIGHGEGKRKEGARKLDQIGLSDQATILQVKDKLCPLGGAEVPVFIGKSFDTRFCGSLIDESERVNPGIPESGRAYGMTELKGKDGERKKKE